MVDIGRRCVYSGHWEEGVSMMDIGRRWCL